MNTPETPKPFVAFPPPGQPAPTESLETRVAFLEAVVSAGNAVGRRPGTAPTTVHIHDERSAAEVQAGVPPKPPVAAPAPPATKADFTK